MHPKLQYVEHLQNVKNGRYRVKLINPRHFPHLKEIILQMNESN